jgi:biotin carboxyl carrier protein
MKSYTITIGDKTHIIGVQELENPDRFRVLAGGKVFEIRVLAVEESDAEIPSIEVLEAARDQPALAHKAPELLPKAPSSSPPDLPEPEAAEELPSEVHAPMPGVILSVEVQPGDHVQRGDTLFVLEAMKMKNPIRSPREGVVDGVFVHEGQSVNYDDLLLRYREGTA